MSKSKLQARATQVKSVVCEVQQWTTTSVAEAAATRERFIALPVRSDDPEGGRCEVFRWAEATVDEVVKMKAKENGLKMRCVECKQPVRFQRARVTVGGATPYFEHVAANLSCSRSEGVPALV